MAKGTVWIDELELRPREPDAVHTDASRRRNGRSPPGPRRDVRSTATRRRCGDPPKATACHRAASAPAPRGAHRRLRRSPPNAVQALHRRLPAMPGVRRSRARLGARPSRVRLQHRRFARREDVEHTIPRGRRERRQGLHLPARERRAIREARARARARRHVRDCARSSSSRWSGRPRRTRSSPRWQRTQRPAATRSI